jgi:hypothetical protein
VDELELKGRPYLLCEKCGKCEPINIGNILKTWTKCPDCQGKRGLVYKLEKLANG